MQKNSLAVFTKVLLDIFFYGGVAVCISLPWSAWILGRFYPTFREFYFPMLFIYAISGILAICIIWQLRKIFRTVISRECFVQENTRSLKAMGAMAFFIAFTMALRLFFVITPATLIIVFVFLVAGLFSLVLAQLFEEAINYKHENDLTI